jgi:hypothetical protein
MASWRMSWLHDVDGSCQSGGWVVCALVHIQGDSHELHPFSVKSVTPISSMPTGNDL